jgi:hypothetical protein
MSANSTAMRLGLVCVLALAILAVPASAGAATVTHTLSGKMVDEATSETDANSKVTVKVVVRNGKPVRLKALAFRRLNGYCRDEAGDPLYFVGQFGGVGGRNRNPRIEVGNLFNWFSYPSNPPRRVEFFGKIRNRGQRIVANLNVYNNTPGQCSFAKGRVRLTKQ